MTLNGIALSNGKIPLITIQTTAEGKEALSRQKPLIKKFKRELLNGTLNLTNLVDSFKGFIAARGGGGNVESFYQEYSSLVALKGKAPCLALELLKLPVQNRTASSKIRREALTYSAQDAEDLRRKIMEGIKELKELENEFS